MNGSSILYSSARQYLLLITSRAPWGQLKLPTMTFADLTVQAARVEQGQGNEQGLLDEVRLALRERQAVHLERVAVEGSETTQRAESRRRRLDVSQSVHALTGSSIVPPGCRRPARGPCAACRTSSLARWWDGR
jgi:hypothetical protein